MNRRCLTLMLALLLSACQPDSRHNTAPASAVPPAASADPTPHNSPAPTTAEWKLIAADYPDELLNTTAANYRNTLSYIPADGETVYHFNKLGQYTSQSDKDGYFRRLLGHTDNGRAVVQDFYQSNKKIQTSAFILKADADPKNFSVEAADSLNIGFRRDGSLQSISRPRDGNNMPIIDNYGKNKQRIAQTQDGYILLLNPDQSIFAAVPVDDNPSDTMTLYRNNGQAMLRFNLQNQEVSQIQVWDEQGKPVRYREHAEAMRPEWEAQMKRVQSHMAEIMQE